MFLKNETPDLNETNVASVHSDQALLTEFSIANERLNCNVTEEK